MMIMLPSSGLKKQHIIKNYPEITVITFENLFIHNTVCVAWWWLLNVTQKKKEIRIQKEIQKFNLRMLLI